MFWHTTRYFSCVGTHTLASTTGIPTVIHVLWKPWEELCNARGWVNDHQRAKALEIQHTTIRRLRLGGRPGEKFIGNTLAVLGVPFERVFERRAA